MDSTTFVAITNAFETLEEANKYKEKLQDSHTFGILSLHGKTKKGKSSIALYAAVDRTLLEDII